MNQELIGGNDKLCVGVSAHALDSAGSASADRIGVATGMFGSDGDGTIRAPDDGTFMVEGIVLAEVNDETGVLGTGRKRYGGAHLNAKRLVGLSVGHAWFRGGVVASAAPNIDDARRGRGSTGVCLSANACGIGRGASVIFDFLLGVLANDVTCQKKRHDEQTADSCKIAT